MAILTNDGRIAIAKAITLRPIHVAWGTGDGAWTTPPAEDVDASSLLAEVGRRTVTAAGFVVPDAGGSIVLPGGNFTISLTPTKYLYIPVVFDYADASSGVIREVAVFVGTELVGGLPGGQKYFVPAEVVDPGLMLHVENFVPIYRSPALRESFSIVIPF